jgi:hypothetical protein
MLAGEGLINVSGVSAKGVPRQVSESGGAAALHALASAAADDTASTFVGGVGVGAVVGAAAVLHALASAAADTTFVGGVSVGGVAAGTSAARAWHNCCNVWPRTVMMVAEEEAADVLLLLFLLFINC